MDYLAKIKNAKLRRIALLMKDHLGRLQVSHQAAELAYFALLALFPTLLVLGNLIPMLPIPKEELLSYLALTLPREISEVINPILNDYLSGGSGEAVSIGILISIWTASKAFSVFQKVLNQVYNTTVRKNVIVQRMFSFIIAFLMVVIIALVTFVFMFGNYILAFLGDVLPIQIVHINTFESLRWVAAFCVIFVVLLTYIYYFVPNVYWSIKFSIPGALFSTVAFLLISQLFSSYVGFAARQAAWKRSCRCFHHLDAVAVFTGNRVDFGRICECHALLLFPAAEGSAPRRKSLRHPLFGERHGSFRQEAVLEKATDPQESDHCGK